MFKKFTIQKGTNTQSTKTNRNKVIIKHGLKRLEKGCLVLLGALWQAMPKGRMLMELSKGIT